MPWLSMASTRFPSLRLCRPAPAEFAPHDGRHLAQVAKGEPMQQAPGHDEGDDIAWNAGTARHTAAAFVGLPATGSAAKAGLAACCDLYPQRHRREATANAVQADRPAAPSRATLFSHSKPAVPAAGTGSDTAYPAAPGEWDLPSGTDGNPLRYLDLASAPAH